MILDKFERLNTYAYIDRTSAPISYDSAYFEKYRYYASTDLGQALSAFREGYVTAFAGDQSVLDYGCGYGTIVNRNAKWWGYDIMHETKEHLGDKYREDWQSFSAICFFDVLEHLQEPEVILNRMERGVRIFVSIPLWSGNWGNPESLARWRHWRPREHFLYCSHQGFVHLVNDWEFKIIDHNRIETSLGRRDIHTYCLEKC